ncbi:MAG: SIR2 family NAD-dependent protein deacylase [Thermoguttaceae bacterium]
MTQEPISLSVAAEWLRAAREVVVFTGAGVSAESGIPTFRDDEGFWQHFPVEEFATWHGLVHTAIHRPQRLADFIYAVLYPIAVAKPNAGHRAIVDLERHTGVTVVTQNIDNLHQEAGSTIVHEVHGSLFEVITRRGRFLRLLSRRHLLHIAEALKRTRRGWFVLPRVLLAIRPVAGLGLRGLHVPRIVLFGDAMAEPDWSHALEAARHCDCMIQAGTSGTVLPAAMLPMEAKAAGAKIITIDPGVGKGDVWLQGTATTVLPQLLGTAFD